ncbi:MAG: hypothetical protein PVF73_07715 [Bacteroidales bacterium]|jgi:hypothetical protein
MMNIKFFSFLLCWLLLNYTNLSAQSEISGFDTTYWNLDENAGIVEFDGRTVLTGHAELNDVEFSNGIIETDIWLDGSRSYPGITFRKQSGGNFETVFLRPHRAGLYDDAIQYAPSFNGQTCWQLYHGKGYTSKADPATNKWIHLKLAVKDSFALFYLGDMINPTLEIYNLALGKTKGSVGLSTWHDRNYFSNFSLTVTDDIPPVSQAGQTAISGNMTNWEISRSFSDNTFNTETYPNFFSIFYAQWEHVKPEYNGLINISRYRGVTDRNAQVIYARSWIKSDTDKRIKVAFGYSDAVKIFLNQKIIYSGNYAYRSRNRSFTGTVTLYDTLYLDLRKGINELFLISKETFGGWGFVFHSETQLEKLSEGNITLEKLWETEKQPLQPESVVYDPANQLIYCSCFDNQFYKNQFIGYVSKVNMQGEIIDLKWIDSLIAPAGMCRYRDKLFILDRKCLVEAALPDGEILNKYPFPDGVSFPNDIAVDEEGALYITNSASEKNETDILVFRDKKFDSWLRSEEISTLNGIYYTPGQLIVGNCEDGLLQAVDVKTKAITTISSIGAGVIDGIQMLESGNYLVSRWKGNLFEISGTGDIYQILDTGEQFNIAAFEYIQDERMLLIPTYMGGTVQAYGIETK